MSRWTSLKSRRCHLLVCDLLSVSISLHPDFLIYKVGVMGLPSLDQWLSSLPLQKRTLGPHFVAVTDWEVGNLLIYKIIPEPLEEGTAFWERASEERGLYRPLLATMVSSSFPDKSKNLAQWFATYGSQTFHGGHLRSSENTHTYIMNHNTSKIIVMKK